MQDKSKVHLAAAIVASLGLAMHVPAEARQLDRDAFKVGGARSLNSKAALAQALTDDSSNKGVEAGCKGKEAQFDDFRLSPHGPIADGGAKENRNRKGSPE